MDGPKGIVHVVDDDRAFRSAIGRLLDASGHEARLYASASEYLAAEPSQGPACVLLDLRMPECSGLDLQDALARRPHRHPVIFLSGHADVPAAVRAMRAGALDFLTKPVPSATLLEAIGRALAQDLASREERRHVDEMKRRYFTLTPRERQVMAGVIAGKLNKQICGLLNAAERTVKTHRAHLMEKMRVRSVAELVRISEDLVRAGVRLERISWD
jgi:FixJ family two-component response regulator